MSWTLSQHQNIENVLMLDNAQLNFENFTEHAPALVAMIGARVCDKNWGADRHAWVLEYDDINLMLEFEDYTNSVWLAVIKAEDSHHLDTIAACLTKNNHPL